MIAAVYENVGRLIVMVFLLAGSAFFSGSETAFFNLTRRQIKQLGAAKNRVSKLLAHLLAKPGQLLNCLLLGNMIVNVLFFALSSVLMLRVKAQWGIPAATGLAFGTFFALVLFGEILPKSLAYASSRPVALAAAVPVYLCVQVLNPVAFLARAVFLEPVLRLLLGHQRLPRAITMSEFRSVIDYSRRRGLITEDENKLLAEVVELGFLKVRHVMQPRVDIVGCDVSEPPPAVRQRMRKHRLTKIPVYIGDIDGVIGIVHLRQLLLRPGVSVDHLVQPAQFVPEQKSVESLLEFFRKTETDMALVVDEYGGIAGSVHLEDIAEELFGSAAVTSDEEPIKQLGPFEYRLSGDLAIHDWADVFGIDLGETRLSTIGGLVTALLGKIPRGGDVARLGNVRFTVQRVRRHRIETVVLSLEPISSHGH
ncbi:MAG: HlyC/CorC family transporter [Sedimentisphaerales bacterium]|nr:HlyC/CorC family transporter [Sedimentisphaerales bacterium]